MGAKTNTQLHKDIAALRIALAASERMLTAEINKNIGLTEYINRQKEEIERLSKRKKKEG